MVCPAFSAAFSQGVDGQGSNRFNPSPFQMPFELASYIIDHVLILPLSFFPLILLPLRKHSLIKDAVSLLADECQSMKRFETARQLNQYLEDNWPAGEQSIGTQQGIALSSIKLGDLDTAQAAIDKLKADFTEHAGLSAARNWVCFVKLL